MATVAEQFIEVLRQAGVERIYGVVGDSLNPVVDAVRRTGHIEWVHVRNEEAGAFAAAAGIGSLRVEDPSDVRDALASAFATPGPFLLDVVTDPDVLAMPPRITTEQVKGFALAASKIVLTGGVGRMVDMAKANLRSIPRP
ncbi:thiamine pyrophosphate-binding protein [Streptosporangium sp. NBC_01755]|nr:MULTISPECIES: thiamine pyrophosphate-binding protein [unclassified Streptosporangium]WSA25521.1 thiamine pyrophosphate-binding protein [Streptosporangium sp. NBC_01810]WSD03091.1 thiamine pyrophosphate-binding protein [Streptosporangium sp. NBC_01755]